MCCQNSSLNRCLAHVLRPPLAARTNLHSSLKCSVEVQSLVAQRRELPAISNIIIQTKVSTISQTLQCSVHFNASHLAPGKMIGSSFLKGECLNTINRVRQTWAARPTTCSVKGCLLVLEGLALGQYPGDEGLDYSGGTWKPYAEVLC